MKRWLILMLVLAMCVVPAAALDGETVPGWDGLWDQAEDYGVSQDTGLEGGLSQLAAQGLEQLKTLAGRSIATGVKLLAVVLVCGLAQSAALPGQQEGVQAAELAGALAITALTMTDVAAMIGLGRETLGRMDDFSQALLPTLAAATAASGAVTTATVQQVSTVFFVDLLLRLIRQLLLPLVYLYIGLLTAAACLPENRLGAIAEALKKLVTWILTTALLVFTIYLSIVRIISGSADSATVKVAKAAISGVVPVVGGIIADASETVLAGAGMLKNTIGVFGMLAILAACAYPFLQLGVQYLLYKLTAYLASVVGAPGLCKLIDGLGGAFGLILA